MRAAIATICVLWLAAQALACTQAYEGAAPLPAIHVREATADAVANDLKGILHRTLGTRPEEAITGKQFNAAFDALTAYAADQGIEITHKDELLGVYPKGLYEIQIAGFDHSDDRDVSVAFSRLHELGHLFHTIQVRATLLRTLSPNGGRISGRQLKAADAFLAHLEDGGVNYRQFEKAVTGAASPVHSVFPRARDPRRYVKRIESLLDGVADGLQSGKIRFPNGMTPEEVYALFISKAPIVVGRSGRELAVRLPFLFFLAMFAANTDMTLYGLDPEDWGVKMHRGRRGSAGFRDFILALLQLRTV